MQQLPSEIRLTYLTVTFLVFVLIVFLIVIVVLYNRKQVVLQQRQQLKETEFHNRLLKQEVEYRKDIQNQLLQISQDMHDDLGSGISAIKLQSEFLKSKVTDGEILENIEDMLQMCGSLNISMREMLWSLNSENDSLRSLVDYISHYAEFFLQKTQIKLCLNEKGICDNLITAKNRRHLFLCVKESLNNVYKHSQAKNVQLNFVQEEDYFSISIIDDGVGLKKNYEKGNGFVNMERRMASVKGEFKIIPEKEGLHIELLMKT